MSMQIKGLVKTENFEYFNCLDTANLKVTFFKVLFGSREALDPPTANVNPDGTFEYTVATGVNSVISELYLEDDGVDILIAESQLICHHNDTDILFVMDESKIGRPVYEKMVERLNSVLSGVSVSQISTFDSAQLAELACLTCMSVGILNRLKSAYQLRTELQDYSEDTDYTDDDTAMGEFADNEELCVPVIFGLLRYLSTSLAQAFTFSRVQFRNNLEQCASLNEIGSSFSGNSVLNTLESCRNVLLMHARDDESYFDAKLIHLATNSYNDKVALLNQALEGGGLTGIIKNTGNSAPLEEVIKVRRLSTYINDYAPFLEHIIDNEGYNLNYWDIASTGPDFWNTQMSGFSPPSGYTVAEFKELCQQNLAVVEPSANLYYHLDGSGISTATNARGALETNKNFNVLEHSAVRFFTVGSGTGEISQDEMNAITELQRTIKLSGDSNNLTVTKAMYTNSATSSSAIVNSGRKAFVSGMSSALSGGSLAGDAEAIANSIWCKASANNDAAIMAALYYKRYEQEGALVPRGLNGYGLVLPEQGGLPTWYPENMIPDETELPNMENLFGSFNTCSCNHCQSVYSPSAYLTDLLNWLRKDVVFPAPSSQTGLNALETGGSIHRRKDIRHIKLSCENTNTLVPYIDIVNEILSVNLLRLSSVYPPTTFPYPNPANLEEALTIEYQKLQTTKSAEEIMTRPEHRFETSENLLKGKYFPWVLPYNVAFDECLSLLRISGKEYHEIIKDFDKEANQYNAINWAKAYLNLNEEEVNHLSNGTTAASTIWQDYWGLPSNTTYPKLGSVMEKSGLDLDGVRDILSSAYVTGGSVITVDEGEGELCDVESYEFDPSFSETIANRFMKFVRLKRKTGLSTWELDTAINNLGGIIDSTLLSRLAACIAFSKNHTIAFSDLMVFFGNNAYFNLLSPSSYSTYYQDKFRNTLFPAGILSFFNSTSSYASDVYALTIEQKQYLSVTLETDVPSIEKIISYLGTSGVIGSAPVSFTPTVLAHIHKYTLLVKAFALDVDLLNDYVTLFGNVFTGNIIKAAWDFSLGLRRYAQLGLSLNEFINLMTGNGDFSISSLDEDAEKVWEDVEKSFQEARLANPELDSSDPANATFYQNFVVSVLATRFNLNVPDLEDILQIYDTAANATWLDDFIDDPDGTTTDRDWANKSADFAPVHKILSRIEAMVKLLGITKNAVANAIKVEAGTLDIISSSATPFYWLGISFSSLTASRLKDILCIKEANRHATLLDLQQINTVTTANDFYVILDDYFNNYVSGYVNASTNITSLYNKLGSASPYKKLSLFEFTEIFERAQALTVSTDPKNLIAVLNTFETIYNVIQTFKIKATDAWKWVWKGSGWKPSISSSTLTQTFTAVSLDYTLSEDIRRTVNSMFPVFSGWSDVIVPVQNELREHLRDALVAYHIGYNNGVDANRLYSYYLIDNQMSSYMKISRVVAAISSVQLLVHRSMLGLESSVMHIDENDKQEWEWRKNYRVWEANRKVFLYPENWIEPSLRKNKTYLFKELEDVLQQDEINERNAEQAFATYLTGLNDLAHLDIRAMYVEDPDANLAAGGGMVYNNSPGEIIHVFARNWNPPFAYYHRKFTRGTWSGWEKLDVEIDSDHLIPCMFNRKLYLFFPVFFEKIYSNSSDANGQNNKQVKYYEIQMCYTKQDFGKWSQKKVLPGKVEAGPRAFQYGATLYEKCNLSFESILQPKVTNPLTSTQIPYYDPNTDINATHGYWSHVSMEKSDFYFWAENTADGNLHIHCRRALDPEKRKTGNTYTQFAFEQGFLINACDERVSIIGENEISWSNFQNKFFLARPYMTMPHYQQMKFGKASFKNSPANIIGADYKMFVKESQTVYNTGVPLFDYADGYILTYPQQYKHNIARQPFFFTHGFRSFFLLYNRSIPALRNIGSGGIGGPGGGA